MAVTEAPAIGLLNERPLHAALKEWLARPGDEFEAPIGRYVVDIVRGSQLIEIQTRSFAPLKKKLVALLVEHPVRLVYPIAQEKWLLKRMAGEPERYQRRKSPRRGAVADIFRELVSFPKLLAEPNFSLELLLIQEEELRRHQPGRAWRRRGWITEERRLLSVVSSQLLESPADALALLPPDLPDPFTTADLAAGMKRSRRLAQQAAYCLRKMGALRQVGKRGRANLFTLA